MFFKNYRDLFECPCPKLHPSLPFRTLAREQIIADITSFFPDKSNLFVYVADRPGGLLFDFILINQLIMTGYHKLQIIIIEPLQELEPIRRAQAQFIEFFENLIPHMQTLRQAPVFDRDIGVSVTIFETWDQYAAEITKKPHLRGNCLITIDPDSPRDLPDPENRHKSYLWHKKIRLLHQPFFWASLYQQELTTNSNRHLFTGTGTITKKNVFIAARHRQGHAHLDQQDYRAWLNHRILVPSDLPELSLFQDHPTHLLSLVPEQVDRLAEKLLLLDQDRPR